MKLYPIVLLAGGLSTRLYPMTREIPKSMINIAGKPFIEHQLKLLCNYGFDHVILCLGYLGNYIKDFLSENKYFGLNIGFSFDGDSLLGTGGAIKNAFSILPDNFFVMYGDSYLRLNYNLVQEKFVDKKKLSLMTVYKNRGKYDSSNVELLDGKIIAYDKQTPKKTMQHIDYGLSIFNKKAFDNFEGKFDLKEVHKEMLHQNQLSAYIIKNRFYEIGSFQGIKELEEMLNKENDVN